MPQDNLTVVVSSEGGEEQLDNLGSEARNLTSSFAGNFVEVVGFVGKQLAELGMADGKLVEYLEKPADDLGGMEELLVILVEGGVKVGRSEFFVHMGLGWLSKDASTPLEQQNHAQK